MANDRSRRTCGLLEPEQTPGAPCPWFWDMGAALNQNKRRVPHSIARRFSAQ
jgi:hypothetical protein